jgi:hypothetical protein
MKRPPPGTIIQIELPNGRYAYARLYEDATVAVYRETSDAKGAPPRARDFRFFAGVADRVFASSKVRVVGSDPFDAEEDPWPPPMRIRDPISGEFRIYHRGQTRVSSADETRGLERAAVWELDGLIERLIALG